MPLSKCALLKPILMVKYLHYDLIALEMKSKLSQVQFEHKNIKAERDILLSSLSRLEDNIKEMENQSAKTREFHHETLDKSEQVQNERHQFEIKELSYQQDIERLRARLKSQNERVESKIKEDIDAAKALADSEKQKLATLLKASELKCATLQNEVMRAVREKRY